MQKDEPVIWALYRGKQMKYLLTGALLCLFSTLSIANKGIDVKFKNNSDGLLKCSLKQSDNYVTFIRLQPNESKSFGSFTKNNSIRCSISINKRATTVLTYFPVVQSGNYELLKEYVSCKKECNGKKDYRWATIAVLPDGTSIYNKL